MATDHTTRAEATRHLLANATTYRPGTTFGPFHGDRDYPFQSRECRSQLHDPPQCHGYYDPGGSAFGHDTYRCLCHCHLQEPIHDH
jgi:hypothetical protein